MLNWFKTLFTPSAAQSAPPATPAHDGPYRFARTPKASPQDARPVTATLFPAPVKVEVTAPGHETEGFRWLDWDGQPKVAAVSAPAAAPAAEAEQPERWQREADESAARAAAEQSGRAVATIGTGFISISGMCLRSSVDSAWGCVTGAWHETVADFDNRHYRRPNP